MKGYKAFDKDLKCRNFQFEVGKTYKHDGEIELCKSGFHFCKKCADCFSYYDFDKNTRICEIEASGNIKESDNDSIGNIIKSDNDSKCVTDEIKIIRELSWNEILNICNSGNRNSGYMNSGDMNSGDRNSGDRNSGDMNSGDLNSGDWNSGNWNSGNWNSGNWNSGYWNSGNWNSGYLNTNEPPVRIFDKETSINRDDLEIPRFFFFDLNVWIDAKDMTEEEQKEHPSWQVTGGYFKTYAYKEAWRKAFGEAKASDNWASEKAKLLALPNFDFKKFEKISGISQKDIEE